METRQNSTLAPNQRTYLADLIHATIVEMLHSNPLRKIKPTVDDEVRGSLTVVENVLWHAVPGHMREVNHALKAIGQPPLPPNKCIVKLDTWIGGDRDGNPNVTFQTTLETITLCQWRAAALYHKYVWLGEVVRCSGRGFCVPPPHDVWGNNMQGGGQSPVRAECESRQ